MQIESTLVNELQIGSRLNGVIEQNRRGEFGLLLAMLSADARDMAQFQLDKDLNVDQKLRKQFSLPPAQSLVADVSTDIHVTDNAPLFQQQGARQFQLQQALTPEAFVIRDAQPDAMVEVLSNCDELTKRKALNSYQQHTVIEDMHFIDQLATQRKISQTMANNMLNKQVIFLLICELGK
ncbi:VC2046/SO_2500 family protein [Shewanella phaeophyticola]|uniref:QueD-like protein n=1 Tax=Shewanella phaeophyticola TaxID=2978345 RepID=A0ABT2P161_9GAMM|nr:VC2046/SO_2500 family protein [Shewanella sp. KJ10-1]MCT8986386.1 queD-like protein [Shewanella sp. KJ10-1]